MGRPLRFPLAIAVICSFTLALVATGCGSKFSGMGNNPPPTVTVSASPTSVTTGGASTLTVVAAYATTVTVTGTDGTSYNMQASGGTMQVKPSATTTYTATATGAGGTTTATATVTVTSSSSGAPTVTLAANPTSIAAGASSTLTVTATNATQVVIAGSDGSSYTLAATGGTQSVSPTATTTYTATATGAGGSVTATATVTVTASAAPLPTVSMTANPASIVAGSSSTLTVTAANDTGVVITGSDGSSYQLGASGGTTTVSPKSTTTYTATATGAGGTATSTATVTVTPPPSPAPTVTISANPTSITSGASSTLSVSATNSTAVTVTGSDGSSYTLAPSGGTQIVNPQNTTTYTATATGAGGTTTATAKVTVTAPQAPTVSITANPTTITAGNNSTLTVVATNATTVTVTGSDGSSYTLSPTGGTQSVSPTSTATYTATAVSTVNGTSTTVTATTTVTVTTPGNINDINHVVFMLQENHTFDNYFGMLDAYRASNNTNGQAWDVGDDGKTYLVDGIDPNYNSVANLNTISNQDDPNASGQSDTYKLFKFSSTCIDDLSSDWLASYGDVNRYDFQTTRQINMDGFVHNAEGYAKSCQSGGGSCSGSFTDLTGERSMGYYDQDTLNYYYYMASQFALSDRWFSPVSSKSIDNRIATFTGGTTQGLTKDPSGDDHLTGQLNVNNIFEELDQAQVSWKIYYTVTQGFCTDPDDCSGNAASEYPATDFSNLSYSYQYLYENLSHGTCQAPTQPSSVVGDPTDSFCIDPAHIAPLSQYYTDLQNGQLPSFAFIEAGYGNNDEHPGSGQSILEGQAEVAKIVNALMQSSSWKDSAFFLAYDEGGGPYEHVPPVPNHTNDYTDPSVKSLYPDISSIAVNPDSYNPCLTPPSGTPSSPPYCDLQSGYPGATAGDAAQVNGFAAQLGFRVPNMVISPFAKRHFVSHVPMDHEAVIKFVEERFIGSSVHLTARDAAEANIVDNFFNFNNPPWLTPPTPPTPTPAPGNCNPQNFTP